MFWHPWNKVSLKSLFKGMFEMDKVGLYHGDLNNGNIKIDSSCNVNFLDFQWGTKTNLIRFFETNETQCMPNFIPIQNSQMFEMAEIPYYLDKLKLVDKNYEIGFTRNFGCKDRNIGYYMNEIDRYIASTKQDRLARNHQAYNGLIKAYERVKEAYNNQRWLDVINNSLLLMRRCNEMYFMGIVLLSKVMLQGLQKKYSLKSFMMWIIMVQITIPSQGTKI